VIFLLKNGPNSIAIIATRAEMYRNRDADYKYRADSSFYYLTGFAEPEAVAVIETFEEGEEYSYSFFAVNVIVKWKSGMVIVRD
jgi:Xaa-Pro aminopeptidase